MTGIVVGVRRSRSSPVIFVESNAAGLELGDLLLADIAGSRFLATVALTGNQLAAIPESAMRGKVIAAPGSVEVGEAARARDAEAITLAQGALGPDPVVLAASWSPDLGRLTIIVGKDYADLEGLVNRLEPLVRAEVRCETQD